MKNPLLYVGLVLFLVVPAGASAQSAATGEDVADLLERLDAVERQRSQVREQQLAPAASPQDASVGPSKRDGAALGLWALVVATGIAALAFVIKRFRPMIEDLESSKALEVTEAIWVGRGQRVFLLRVREQEVLVGASGGRLSSLAILSPEGGRLEEAAPSRRDVVANSSREQAEQFVSLVEEELSGAARGGQLRAKKNILRRLNNI